MLGKDTGGNTMKFKGTIYRGSLEGHESIVDLGIVKDGKNWVIQSLEPGKKPITSAIIGYVIASDKVLRFTPELFRKGIIIYTWGYFPTPSLITVDKIIEL